MKLMFRETHSPGVHFDIEVEEHLCSRKTPYQQIDMFTSKEFGTIFVLDGYIMLTEKDEFIYHDMIVHVPMAANLAIKKVLVIGGGDGGSVRELCRYDSIEHIDMVEIDEMVVEACKEFLPQTSVKFDDPRLTLSFEDGLKFVQTKENEYDLIIVDSTDPIGPGEGLFTREFYGNCYKALKKDGILVNQHESAYYAETEEYMKRAHRRINEFFPICRIYQAHIPTYASGHWLFGFASKTIDPVASLDADAWNALGIKTRYYNTELHKGCFALPNYVKEMLAEALL